MNEKLKKKQADEPQATTCVMCQVMVPDICVPCYVCGFDNKPAPPLAKRVVRLPKEDRVRSISDNYTEAVGRRALPPRLTPKHDDYSEESFGW